VNFAVYTVEDTGVKSDKVPLDTVMSAEAKSVVGSLDVKVKVRKASLDVAPSLTPAAAMVIVGAVESYVQENELEAVFPSPEGSVNALGATSKVQGPSPAGVNVPVYILEDTAVKPDIAPFVTVISPTTKSPVALFEVNVKVSVPSLEVAPLETSVALIAIVGGSRAVEWADCKAWIS
jgi:hypothetical protein